MSNFVICKKHAKVRKYLQITKFMAYYLKNSAEYE